MARSHTISKNYGFHAIPSLDFFFRTMYPSENTSVAILALGEGFHNYHHAFPWDYKTSELGQYYFNITTVFIDFMAKIGWAYDLKTTSERVITDRIRKKGDGSHVIWGSHSEIKGEKESNLDNSSQHLE